MRELMNCTSGMSAGTSPRPTPLAWRSIVEGADRERAVALSREIVTSIWEKSTDLRDPWSAAQSALLLREYARSTASAEAARQSDALMVAAIELLGATTARASFFDGFVGVAWVAERLCSATEGVALAIQDESDLNTEIDRAVLNVFERPLSVEMGFLDLISGLVGIGVYALERHPRARAVECLERIVDTIAARSEPILSGLTWWTRSELAAGDAPFCCNFGLAHGIPGLISFLAAAFSLRVAPRKTLPLLTDAVTGLLAERLPSGPCRFPTVRTLAGVRTPSRAAWCYGDPGIALALLAAARATGRHDWGLAAVDTAECAARRPEGACGVVDASVCHGSAGLLHVYNRFFQATNAPLFKGAALHWLRRTLELCKPGQHRVGPEDVQVLEGRLGVALTLLSATSQQEPLWDRMILASMKGDGAPPGPVPSARRDE